MSKPEGMIIRGRLRVSLTRSAVPLLGDDFRREWARGRLEVVRDQHNLIVNNGLSAISRFLGNNQNAPLVGGSPFTALADLTIGSMQIGDTVTPPAPQATDTTGVGSLVYSPNLSFSYPDDYSVMVSGVIPLLELDGVTITEESLKTVSGLLFAKVVLNTPIVKTTAAALQFDHQIIFARA